MFACVCVFGLRELYFVTREYAVLKFSYYLYHYMTQKSNLKPKLRS